MDKFVELISDLISKINPKGRWKVIDGIILAIIGFFCPRPAALISQ